MLKKNSLINQEPRLVRHFSVLHCIRMPFWMRCGFWPVIHSYGYPCSSQSFPSDKNCWRILDDFHCQRSIKIFDRNCGLFMRLQFTIGCYNRRRTSRRRQSFQFSRIQVLFADHLHRRSRVYNKFSFLKFKIWWRRQTLFFFRKWECCFIFSFKILGYFWTTSTLLHGHIALPIPSLLENWSSNFGALGLRWWGSPWQIIPSDGFWPTQPNCRVI